MAIDPLSGVTRILPASGSGTEGTAGDATRALDSFGRLLGAALERLNSAEATADSAIARFAAGEDVELHQVMLAVQESEMALLLGVQVRNKIVEAYQEVMRMQV